MDGRDADTRWWTSPRRLIRRLLSLDDSAHAIALGTAYTAVVRDPSSTRSE